MVVSLSTAPTPTTMATLPHWSPSRPFRRGRELWSRHHESSLTWASPNSDGPRHSGYESRLVAIMNPCEVVSCSSSGALRAVV